MFQWIERHFGRGLVGRPLGRGIEHAVEQRRLGVVEQLVPRTREERGRGARVRGREGGAQVR